MEEFSSWRPCLGCFHSSRRSSPTAVIKDRNLRKRLQKFCRISTLKSSNVPIRSADLWSCPNAGSSSAPSHGSIAAEGSPRIGRISTERRSRSCASPKSASCSENSAIRREVSGRTLRLSEGDARRLARYDWPGNVRELQNVIERAAILAQNGRLRIDLPDNSALQPSAGSARLKADTRPVVMTASEMRDYERANILAALQACGGKPFAPRGAPHTLHTTP